ncbi:hypothetical protein METUNv1_02220 [Methyloversatilis universalis FAM5]|uniref:Uncharacterized protein n=1 Tax=Methyloversatilis universalis (strain ATCC BAA-1314 / DSM 25237 / JCM 13912 / CCUG 52030 / FAM5) TaxID=1000565 RepID=F5RD60_METUF|nr:hypothetical protein METUNv1_02220 [Methyloversatilis universalis FAM5]
MRVESTSTLVLRQSDVIKRDAFPSLAQRLRSRCVRGRRAAPLETGR